MQVLAFFEGDIRRKFLGVLSVPARELVLFYDETKGQLSKLRCFKETLHAVRPTMKLRIKSYREQHLPSLCRLLREEIRDNELYTVELTDVPAREAIAAATLRDCTNVKFSMCDLFSHQVVEVFSGEVLAETLPEVTLDSYLSLVGGMRLLCLHRTPSVTEEESILAFCRYLFAKNVRIARWTKYVWLFFEGKKTTARVSGNLYHNLCVPEDEAEDAEEIICEMLQTLEQTGYIRELELDRKRERCRFLFTELAWTIETSGSWLEYAAYLVFRNLFGMAEMSYAIDWNRYDGLMRYGNEIDVVAMYRCHPLIVSCKMVKKLTASQVNEVLAEAWKLGGELAIPILVTTAQNAKNDDVLQRANDLGVTVLYPKDLFAENARERILRTLPKGKE